MEPSCSKRVSQDFFEVIQRELEIVKVVRIILCFSLLYGALSLQAQEDLVQVERTEIDWYQAKIYLELNFSNRSEADNKYKVPDELTRNRVLALEHLKREASSLLNMLPIDSQSTFYDLFRANRDIFLFYKDLPWKSLVVKRNSQTNQYFALFSLTLYPNIIAPLISHQVPQALPIVPNRSLEEPVTGIIIYVPKELPARGSLALTTFQPALFTRVLDPQLNPIISREFISPEILKRTGAIPYVHPKSTERLVSFVGQTPLFVTGKELWGVLASDIIISQVDAQKILGQEKYRNFIREGKFVVMVDLPSVSRSLTSTE